MRYHKLAGAVENDTRGRARRSLSLGGGRGDGDDEPLVLAGTVIERAHSRIVVRHPERTAGRGNDTPGVLQIRVRVDSQTRHGRNQVRLQIAGIEQATIFQALQNRPVLPPPVRATLRRHASQPIEQGTHDSLPFVEDLGTRVRTASCRTVVPTITPSPAYQTMRADR